MNEYQNIVVNNHEGKNNPKHSSICSCPISSIIGLIISLALIVFGFSFLIYLKEFWDNKNFLYCIFFPSFFVFIGISFFACPHCGRISINYSNGIIKVRELKSFICLNKTYEIKINEITSVTTEDNKKSSWKIFCWKIKAFNLVFTLNNGEKVITIEGELDVAGTRRNMEEFLAKYGKLDNNIEIKNENRLYKNSDVSDNNPAASKSEKEKEDENNGLEEKEINKESEMESDSLLKKVKEEKEKDENVENRKLKESI